MVVAHSAPPTVGPLLDALDPEQRAAATLPDGPAQVIAPAGSGKTTTLIARLGVLLTRGVPAERIAVVTFNREAAGELSARIASRLGPLLPGAGGVEVRTLHALARQVLLDAGDPVHLLADRLPLLRAARRRVLAGRAPDEVPVPDAAALDTLLSAWKIEGRAPPAEAAPALAVFDSLLAARGALDFDDLVVRAVDLLDRDAALRGRWQARFLHLAVDEFQDVDAAQLRLVRILAEPEQNLFVVGDDDQTIYAWRLAEVKYTGSQSHLATGHKSCGGSLLVVLDFRAETRGPLYGPGIGLVSRNVPGPAGHSFELHVPPSHRGMVLVEL